MSLSNIASHVSIGVVPLVIAIGLNGMSIQEAIECLIDNLSSLSHKMTPFEHTPGSLREFEF